MFIIRTCKGGNRKAQMRKKFKIVVGLLLALGLLFNSSPSDKDNIAENTISVIIIPGEDETIGGKH